MKRLPVLTLVCLCCGALSGCGQNADTPTPVSESSATAREVSVSSVERRPVTAQLKLPGDLLSYRQVDVYAKMPAFVSRMLVDRGSHVKKGQLLLTMTAPELGAQTGAGNSRAIAAQDQLQQAQTNIAAAEQEKREAQAKLAADTATYNRLKSASSYPGVISGNDLEQALHTVEADKAHVQGVIEKQKGLQALARSCKAQSNAAACSADSARAVEAYLEIRAPFDGVVTERNVHEGSFASPPSGAPTAPMLRVSENDVLRLTVPVPESDLSGVNVGMNVSFTVSAYPGEVFNAAISRLGEALDLKTRTMPVEMDAVNHEGKLAPGMYAEVSLPVSRPEPALVVPTSAVVRTTERTFVVKVADGVARWVDVTTGRQVADKLEVFSPELQAGDQVVTDASDELREGMRLAAKRGSRPASAKT